MIENFSAPTRRDLLSLIGKVGGGAALYQAMTALGHATESQFTGPPKLTGARPGASVLVLGGGLAGMSAAYELTKAGYKVQVLEFQGRAGGRNYTLHGGDTVTEIGSTQKVGFAPGNYLNPGPWRIPYHHRTVLHYCKQLGVELEPFSQINHNALVHHKNAFGGKPQHFRDMMVDFKGHVSELLGKALNAGALDQQVTAEDKEKLLEAMREWGVLDKNMTYSKSMAVADQRGYERAPGGGVNGAPIPNDPASLSDMLSGKVWQQMGFYAEYVMQTTMFQPKGGMDQIGKAFFKHVGKLVRLNTKVTKVTQDDKGVTATWQDAVTGAVGESKADFMVCTIPATVLNQLDIQLSPEKKAAIRALPYGNSVKIGLEMKRRFWETDYAIYGGHSFTDQAISLISYPSAGFFKEGPAVLLGAYPFGAGAYQLAGMTPEKRIEAALAQGSVFHPAEYRAEFLSGASVAWSRMPWILGCCATWTEESRAAHYQNLVSMENRIVLAGEHCSYYGCWQEGALLSSLDAVTRLHQRALAA
ncbi:flavin monoamine oxidase family protein [Novosphingobium sp. KCTC 2891]|uniref:flavin monoamine oxidase family protein n=1 Tax=Novosphingobium sp. KCTC 2891 TaxID=2989730 RepID=UPI002222E099|nr:flavin monoamine oxidase family protein [Novosphingobium sp. KCTC 2891]MCW1381403.1 flavin monoamine oxidase family protein [Novosphingobium sp. KCTC 2891]